MQIKKSVLEQYKKQISHFHREGLSNSQIADEIGKSMRFVSDHTQEKDIEYKIKKQAADIARNLKIYYKYRDKGYLKKDAAKEAGITAQIVKTYGEHYLSDGFEGVHKKHKSNKDKQRIKPKKLKPKIADYCDEEIKINNLWSMALYRSSANA